jgi:ferredoxin/flavodoxin---NADP+ reductase
MAYVITQNCCNDATCVTVCPVNCIHPTPDEPEYATAEMLYIDAETCIDCGACVDVCPVEAISPDFELTEYTEKYLEVNAHYFTDPAHKEYSPAQYQQRKLALEVAEPGPLWVAIVGAGPAASYAAEELLTRKGLDVRVQMFERLPTPWGLVRYGVAPDHQATKSVTDSFVATSRRPDVEMFLNVEVGKHVTHEELLAHHHAVIYAVGAQGDRRLDVPGEDLPGSHSATDFVAWYNGHPEFADRSFDLSTERAVVVGNGNVALDVARILTSDVAALARTDIADQALEALAESKVSEVIVLGRRGPAQAAFTTPELLGLSETEGIDLIVDPAEAEVDLLTSATLEPHDMATLKTRILADLSRRSQRQAKRVVLRFLASPVAIVGEDRVRGIQVVRNELIEASGRITSRPADAVEDLECGLVLRAVGYRGRPLPGLPFDGARGTLPHARGRVVDPDTGLTVTGVYTAGWIKRGPSGGIGTNKRCAEETVNSLLEDYATGWLKGPPNDADSLRPLIAERQPDVMDFGDWTAIDRHERKLAGRSRPRVKLTSIHEMVAIATGSRPDAS